jgi:hypothetical protein
MADQGDNRRMESVTWLHNFRPIPRICADFNPRQVSAHSLEPSGIPHRHAPFDRLDVHTRCEGLNFESVLLAHGDDARAASRLCRDKALRFQNAQRFAQDMELFHLDVWQEAVAGSDADRDGDGDGDGDGDDDRGSGGGGRNGLGEGAAAR